MRKYLFFVLIFMTSSFANDNPVSRNIAAQQLFTKAMRNYYGYLYIQAEYDFRQALIHDPKCAMCYWGLALAKKQQALELGQNFAKIGLAEIRKAQQLQPTKNHFFDDVIKTASITFSPDLSQKQLQNNYIKTLRTLYQKYKNNKIYSEESLALLVDAIAYYANVEDSEKLSHCGPHLNEQYRKEALTLLVPILKDARYRDHPGLLHTYIHLAEQQLKDPLGELAARKLPQFSNGEIAHYTHMPNHIYWRRGKYEEAIAANLATIAIDQQYFKNKGVGLTSYYYEYHFLHSHHFLSVLGVLTNNFELAIYYARAVKNLMDEERIANLKDYRDTFLSLEHLILARFKKWPAVLQLETSLKTNELGLLMIDFTKALAYLNLGQAKQFSIISAKINNKKYLRKNMQELQLLVMTYLKAAEMDSKKFSFSQIENIFLKNNIGTVEAKFSTTNPPLWLFPSTRFLYESAKRNQHPQKAEQYYDLYQKVYPAAKLLG